MLAEFLEARLALTAIETYIGFDTSRAVFKMTVESNYVIVIATLSDWLIRAAPVFQPMRSKPKTNRTM